MAVTPREDDRYLKRIAAEVTLWQEMLEQLVELRRNASAPDPDAYLTVKNENWRQRAESARRHAAEHTDPATKQALLELAESYDLLAQRDERAKT
jgi:hypothetical protein